MNLNLTPEEITRLKAMYGSWEEIESRKKELSSECKDVCKAAAEIIGSTKASDASKLFKNMSMLSEGLESEADNISLLLDKIRGNS